jgi:hypothetical protein
MDKSLRLTGFSPDTSRSFVVYRLLFSEFDGATVHARQIADSVGDPQIEFTAALAADFGTWGRGCHPMALTVEISRYRSLTKPGPHYLFSVKN